MTQSVYHEPMISTYPSYIASQTPAFDIYTYSLFPRHSLPVVLQATVGGGEDLGMTLLLCEVYASGKR